MKVCNSLLHRSRGDAASTSRQGEAVRAERHRLRKVGKVEEASVSAVPEYSKLHEHLRTPGIDRTPGAAARYPKAFDRGHTRTNHMLSEQDPSSAVGFHEVVPADWLRRSAVKTPARDGIGTPISTRASLPPGQEVHMCWTSDVAAA